MFQLINITKQYADGSGIRKVLDGLSLQVDDGDFVSITGESGSGKTTLLSILGTLITPDEGTYSYEGGSEKWIIKGSDPLIIQAEQLSVIRNKQIGIVFQDHRLLPQFTAIQNILLPCLADKDSVSDTATKKAEELMQFMGITSLKDKYVTNLSGGEKTRVAICRALINEPRLLLADEPTGQLDEANAKIIAELFKKINAELHTTIVMVTHSDEMAKVANKHYHLHNGTLQ